MELINKNYIYFKDYSKLVLMIIVPSIKAGAQSLQTPNVAKGKVQVWKRTGKLKHCKKPLSEKLSTVYKVFRAQASPDNDKNKFINWIQEKKTEFEVVFKHWNSNQNIEFLFSLRCF